MVKKLIIGLGTGRCGTSSLSRFLTDQPGIRVLHEGRIDGAKSPPIRWEGDHENLLRWLDELATLCGSEQYYGDIGMYFLPYVEFLVERFDNIQFICLKRNRKAVIKSYLNWTENRNHWYEHDGSFWERDERWDAAYPKFDEPDKAKALGLYWDMYHAEVDRLVAKYPSQVVCLPMDCLNHAAGQNQILDFIGYGGDRRIASKYVFNKGIYPIERFVDLCQRRVKKWYRETRQTLGKRHRETRQTLGKRHRETRQTLEKWSRQSKRFAASRLCRMRDEGFRKIHQALIVCMNLAMWAGQRALPKAVRHFLWTRCAERIHGRLYGKNPPAKPVVHFLHIGKTGGTAIRHALQDASSSKGYAIRPHGYEFRLSDVPKGEHIVFFLRDPISRFVSGFYSRQRQGQPRYFWAWSPAEKEAFETFKTPNELAASLFSQDEERKSRAERAMRGISHVNSSYWQWFENEQYFRARLADVFFIGFQETLQEDFAVLKSKLGLPDSAKLPEDDAEAHRNPQALNKKLEEKAIENLRRWYQDDYKFYYLCQNLAKSTR